MLRQILSIAAVLPIVVALSTSPAAAADEGVGESGYYPLKVGTEWEYRAGDKKFISKVVKHEKQGDRTTARIEMSADGQVVASENNVITKEGVLRIAAADVVASKPAVILKLPPKAGDKWKVETDVGMEKLEGEMVCDAIDEKVKVPAGEFTTVKITGSFTTTGQTGEKRMLKVSTWYHEGTGPVKVAINAQGTDVALELEKYKPAP